MMFSQRSATLIKTSQYLEKNKKYYIWLLIWLKLNAMFFLYLDYYFHNFCSHVIGTFQERAVNDELNRS